MAGYTMIYRRAFKVGDRISVDNVIGDVTERRLMVTHLRTLKNEEVVVPNSTIINSNIMNYSTLARSRGLILHTTVGIGYEPPGGRSRPCCCSPRNALRAAQGARAIRAAEVAGRFCRDLRAQRLLRRPHAMWRLYTAMHQNILDVFNEHGVQIMTPAYEGDPEQPKVVPKEQWYQAPATPLQTPANERRKP